MQAKQLDLVRLPIVHIKRNRNLLPLTFSVASDAQLGIHRESGTPKITPDASEIPGHARPYRAAARKDPFIWPFPLPPLVRFIPRSRRPPPAGRAKASPHREKRGNFASAPSVGRHFLYSP